MSDTENKKTEKKEKVPFLQRRWVKNTLEVSKYVTGAAAGVAGTFAYLKFSGE